MPNRIPSSESILQWTPSKILDQAFSSAICSKLVNDLDLPANSGRLAWRWLIRILIRQSIVLTEGAIHFPCDVLGSVNHLKALEVSLFDILPSEELRAY